MGQDAPLVGVVAPTGDEAAEYGVPLAYDANYEGVATERKFHDPIFIVLFLIFFFGFFGLVAWASTQFTHPVVDPNGDNNTWLDLQLHYLAKDSWIIALCTLFAAGMAFGWLIWIKKQTYCVIITTLCCVVGLIALEGLVFIFAGLRLGGGGIGLITMGAIFVGLACFMAYLFRTERYKRRINFTATVMHLASSGLEQNSSLMWGVAPAMLLLLCIILTTFLGGVYFILNIQGAVVAPQIECGKLPNYLDCSLAADINNNWNNTTPNDDPNAQVPCEWRYTTENKYTCQNTHKSGPVGLVLVLFFGWLWAVNFKIGSFQVMVAGTIARWYFAINNANITGSHVATAAKNALMASGSIACGSLIIAVVQFCRAILNASRGAKRNAAAAVIYCCCKLLCCLLEALLKYVTRYANIYVAMHGTSFYQSCKSVYNLFMRGGWQAIINDVLTGWVIGLGSLVAGLIMGVVGFLVILASSSDDKYYHVFSLVMIFLFAIVVFAILGQSLKLAVDTIFVCFMEDVERNGANGGLQGPGVIASSVCGHPSCPNHVKRYKPVETVTGQVVQ